MPSEKFGDYVIEYTGVKIVEVDRWAAYLTIFGPSSNPMHRYDIFPAQRVCVETVFTSKAEAEATARSFALSLLE
jgi:hypothetical protein